MKRKIILPGLATGMVAIGFALANLDPQDGEPLSAKLTVDHSAPERSGPFGGYSSIVEQVSPSIVSIFTTRTSAVPAATSPDLERFFDDPRFRDFFGSRRPELRPGPQPKQRGLGSGVVLTEDGLILTNNHVVERADEIRVQLTNGRKYDATTIATDPASDLAVIKVDAEGLPAATVGDSDQLMAGDLVLAIGSPFGLKHTVTSGIVSAIDRDNLNIAGYENFIQTDASINPGNSGGALIDNKGRVVGINTAILSRTGGNVGIGFAIPINMAVHIAEQLIAHGEMKRGYLGVTLGNLEEDLADALGVNGTGVVVNEVMEDTPAAEAGFRPGDVITAVNGQSIEDIADVRLLVSRENPGTALDFDLRRGDDSLKLTATLGELSDALASRQPMPAPSPVPSEGALAGVNLGELDDEQREQLGLADEANGVLVLEVDSGSAAADAGLQRGHVILEVNREAVRTPREAYAQARDRSERATLLRVFDGTSKRFLAIG